MAFRFDAQADSSDEDGPVDINAWKSGNGSSFQPSSFNQNSRSPAHKGSQSSNGFQAINVSRTDKESAEVEDTPSRPSSADGTTVFADAASEVNNTPKDNDNDDDLRAALDMAGDVLGTQEEEGQYELEEQDELREQVATIELEAKGASQIQKGPARRVLHAVQIPDFDGDISDFEDLTADDNTVRRICSELVDDDGTVVYEIEFEDRHVDLMASKVVLSIAGGRKALETFNAAPTSDQQSMRSTRHTGIRRPAGFVDPIDAIDISNGEEESEDELAYDNPARRGKRKQQDYSQYDAEMDKEEEEEVDEEDGEITDDNDDYGGRFRRTRRNRAPTRRSLRSTMRPSLSEPTLEEDELDPDLMPFLDSDVHPRKRRRRLQASSIIARDLEDDATGSEQSRKRQRFGDRQSGRQTRHKGNMREVDVDDIYRTASDSDRGTGAPAKPRAVAAKQIFKQLPRNDEFRMRHNQECESCGQNANYAPLIYCQGCTLAYHKSCLGHRSAREHLITKIGEDDFVLQCRRCVAVPKKKDPSAPDQGKCSDCFMHGAACIPFGRHKTVAQEQRERDDNGGIDPITEVDPSLINQAENVLFRCLSCWRAFHFEHLPSRNDLLIDLDGDVDTDQRFREYSRDWKCKECFAMPAKVTGLVAWKPIDEDSYDAERGFEGVNEEGKAYLVRWEGMSYFRAAWMPGPWVWGVVAAAMRKAFAKRNDSTHPKMRIEDAIPEDYLRADIVLAIKYTSYVEIRGEDIDKARIREIDRALIKYKGLGYEDAVWEKPPTPEDGDRWTDFVAAYNDWVTSRYIKPPTQKATKSRTEKLRAKDFRELEKTSQPDTLTGGDLMKYQIEGLNWLYYKWYSQKNAILADEMGLGKTIQIIGFLATLVTEINCFPFLIVVPNSTCPNWRREIKRWSPSLRAVAFYGSKESRDAAYKYEMFPEGTKELKAHIVVTSYDAAADESCKRFFRSVSWQGLIVDEGQRLKSEKTLLYSALGALKAPFKVLLTGTPLQNNQRELFNLLQFLDDSYNAEELEKEYEDLTAEKITELHNMIRPFFLRRTKAQVLTFLPPMAQIIVPVSMTLVQKKVYRTILAKNPDLMKAIFSNEANLGKVERASLSNILMQLRKCLCHPFVYNKSIEDRNVSIAASHRNLVDASSKLKLLELLLPKLKERGHRVLIFSQFLENLDIVEDFLDGMQLRYQRLDGSINSLNKQKRIDEFNAGGSPLFAFLLSTRAGGVGINLASADTVIIMDPDFNPHQDIQALSRAHRIGQHKKVLCFQLVTRASAEEKIMQIGRKKLALDHVLIRGMDDDEATESDLTTVLRHGASELFENNGDQDINYDDVSVEKLLDRSHLEDTQTGKDQSAEAQFSFARVWENSSSALQDVQVFETEDLAPNQSVWENILRERERVAAEEAAAKAEAFGRGRRARQTIGYAEDKQGGLLDAEGIDVTPATGKRAKNSDESDTDFQADDSDGDSDKEGEEDSDLDQDDAIVVEGAKRVTGQKKGKQQASKTLETSKSTSRPSSTSKDVQTTSAKSKASASTMRKLPRGRMRLDFTKVKKQVSTQVSTLKKPRSNATALGVKKPSAKPSPMTPAATPSLPTPVASPKPAVVGKVIDLTNDDTPLQPRSEVEHDSLLDQNAA